jgi:hypothetical protein
MLPFIYGFGMQKLGYINSGMHYNAMCQVINAPCLSWQTSAVVLLITSYARKLKQTGISRRHTFIFTTQPRFLFR